MQEAYHNAVRAEPKRLDARHYNFALLCERHKRPKDAIRHMSQYRRLTAARVE